MLTIKNFVVSLLLLMAISLSGWSIFIGKKSDKEKPTNSSTEPDAYMENVVATIFNKEGTPSMKIQTPKMVHYMDHDTTRIEKPHITVYRESPEPWYIHSDYARATQGIDNIFFWSNVVIHHDRDIDNPTTTMTTATLTVFPNKQLAQTDEAITVTQPDTVLRAKGMLANMNDGTVKLLSEARGEYAPTS